MRRNLYYATWSRLYPFTLSWSVETWSFRIYVLFLILTRSYLYRFFFLHFLSFYFYFGYEQDKLKDYENIRYTPSRDRQWHLYTVTDKPRPIQRMFLRTFVRQPISNEGLTVLDQVTTQSLWTLSFTSRSILRSIISAMEELELNSHNSAIKPDHAHMYLYILREQQINDLLPYQK